MFSTIRSAAGAWAAAVASRLREGPIDLYEVDGYVFRHRRRSYDRYIIDEVWKKGEYFLDRLVLAPGDAVVDVGAHIGSFAVKASALFPGSPIIALEPVPANFRLLQQNLARNACDRVTAVNLAVMASAGGVSVFLDPENTAGHSTVAPVSGDRVAARAITLADVWREHGLARVGLLKIDCEGAEYEIILDSPDDIWTGIQNLAVEYHPVDGHTFQDLQQCLTERGFGLTAHKDGYFPGQGTALFQRTPA